MPPTLSLLRHDPPINVVAFDSRDLAAEALRTLLEVVGGAICTAPPEVHQPEYVVRASAGLGLDTPAAPERLAPPDFHRDILDGRRKALPD